jgi:hypothetical protein
MEDVLTFIREYSKIYKLERYLALFVSIITLIILISFFGYQLFTKKNEPIETTNTIINGFIGLGSSGIITVSIGYIFKFMDKALKAAERFIKEPSINNNENN